MKFNFKLAQKDIRLLLTFLIVAILGGAWFGYDYFSEKVTAIENETKTLENKKKDLSMKYAQKSMYIVKSSVYQALYEKVINSYSAGLDQETIIMDLRDMEIGQEAWINAATFTDIGLLHAFGSVRSSNPATEGSVVYASDLKGLGSLTSLSFEGEYDNFKLLLNRINNSTFKYKIDSISLSYNGSSELVSGSVELNNYAIAGGDRFFPPTTVDGVPLGTENIFKSETYSDNTVDRTYLDVIKTNYDVYMYLNADTADVESFVIGMKNDVLGKAQITKNSNTRENVVINVTGRDGNYKISYKIGEEVYPSVDMATGADFVFGESLDVLVVSTPRLSPYDVSQANVTIINDTDRVLNLGILNEDSERPRFYLEKTVGSVLVYQ